MSTAADPLDRSQIELLLSIDDGAGNALAEIVESFQTSSWEDRAALREAVRVGDHEALARSAHSLKGASVNVGANELAAACAELERLARTGAPADVEAQLECFESEFTRTHVALVLLAPGS
jgi:histidine phosphotransfer protein HptB